MRRCARSFVMATAVVASASSATAQSRLAGKPTHLTLAVNGGVQQAANEVTDRFSFPKNVQTETVDVKYPMKPWALVDVGVSYRFWKNLALGVAASRVSGNGTAEVTATVPHPFFFDQPRTVTGTESGIVHGETDAHLQLQVVLPSSGSLHVVIGAGPSYVRAEHEVVTDVTVVESYPYDTAAFGGAVTRITHASATGYNAGLDVAWMFARSVGVGGLIRYTRADIDLAPADGRSLAIKAGGVQGGVGIRLLF